MKDPTRPKNLEQEERIRWAVGYEGHYAVTDKGGVYSYKQSEPRKLSPWEQTVNGSYNRLVVSFSMNGIVTKKFVHHLVLLAFSGPREGRVCRHLNGNSTDNRIENLKWGTMQQNSDDRKRHENSNKGERHGMSRFTNDDVLQMRKSYWGGDETTWSLSKDYDTYPSTIWKIVNGKSWTHVGGPTGDFDE